MPQALFVNPSWDRYISKRGRRYNRHWPPLDLLSCAGLLEAHGWECRIHDQRVQQEPDLRWDDYDRIFVTSSPLDRWQCPNLDLELLAERIQDFPERTCLLGSHGTMDPAQVLLKTGKRAVVREEPEIAVLKLAQGENLEKIAGLSYRDGERVFHNPASSPPPLSELPPPAYHLLDLSLYGYELLGQPLALLEASRGCPHSCTFCYLGMYPKYRLKSPNQVVQEVEAVLKRCPEACIYFIDLEFAIQRRHTQALLDALRDSGLQFSWACQTRADSVDRELLEKMKRTGCRLVHFGVESASPRIMEMVDKRLELEKVSQAIELTRQVGIESACFFMLGFPGESEKEIQQTLAFSRQLNPSYASFHIATPYPDTPMYEEFHQPSGSHFIDERYQGALEEKKLKRLERQAYLRFYLRPNYWASQLFQHPTGLWRRARLFLEFLAVG